MSRISKISSEDALAAELSADERRRTRATGFNKMHERDQAWKRLSNGVVMLWHVDKTKLPIGATGLQIPEDSFVLVINGENYLFNTDEFRQSLRWA